MFELFSSLGSRMKDSKICFDQPLRILLLRLRSGKSRQVANYV